MSTCRRLQIDSYLLSYTKLKFKLIKDPNINLITLTLIGREVGSSLEHINSRDHFINITSVAQKVVETINKWDFLKQKSFCKAKDMVNKTK